MENDDIPNTNLYQFMSYFSLISVFGGLSIHCMICRLLKYDVYVNIHVQHVYVNIQHVYVKDLAEHDGIWYNVATLQRLLLSGFASKRMLVLRLLYCNKYTYRFK